MTDTSEDTQQEAASKEEQPVSNETAPETGSSPDSGESKTDSRRVMIKADDLCKYYGRFTAVGNLSFEIYEGEIVAFLGPNGAGKSTTMKMLTGYLSPTSGHAEICGHDISTDRLAVANKLGYLPENGPLYLDMTPDSLLRFFAQARGYTGNKLKACVDKAIQLTDLSTVRFKPIGKLSRGFKQRVGMAQAMLHEPEVLIMDEPTAGLDPNQIKGVRRTIRELGKTILLSTHILQEVEEMATRVLLISDGELRFDGTVEELKASGTMEEKFYELTH